jgi:Flp pilus assembly pilin Flp
MSNSRYARLYSARGVKRGSEHARGNKDRWNELGASLVEYALILSLVAVVAIGALVYLGRSVSNTVSNVAVAVTPDPQVTPDTSAIPTTGGNCRPNLSFCQSGYAWLDGMWFDQPPGKWLQISSGATSATQINDQTAFQLGTGSPQPWTCAAVTGGVCTSIDTNVVGTAPFALGTS